MTCVFLAYNKQLRNSQKQTLFEWVKKTYFWSLKITLTARVPVLFIFLRVRRSIYLPAGVGYFCIKSTAKSMITRLSLCVSRSWTRHFVKFVYLAGYLTNTNTPGTVFIRSWTCHFFKFVHLAGYPTNTNISGTVFIKSWTRHFVKFVHLAGYPTNTNIPGTVLRLDSSLLIMR